MPNFGKKSNAIKATLHPYLSLLCDAVVEYYDITLIRGLSSKAKQNSLYAAGLSEKAWPHSKHNVEDEKAKFPDNLSMAVDASPWPIPEGWGTLNKEKPFARDLIWKERVKFYQMVAVFQTTWARMQEEHAGLKDYELRVGADWDGDSDFRDQDFDDLVHFELIKIK